MWFAHCKMQACYIIIIENRWRFSAYSIKYIKEILEKLSFFFNSDLNLNTNLCNAKNLEYHISINKFKYNALIYF